MAVDGVREGARDPGVASSSGSQLDNSATAIAAAMGLAPRLAESLFGSRRRRTYAQLSKKFRDGKIDEVLEAGAAHGQAGASGPLRVHGGAELPRHDTVVLGHALGGGSGPGACGWLGGEAPSGCSTPSTSRPPRRPSSAGDFRRAAFIHAKPSNNPREAAEALACGGSHLNAGVVFRDGRPRTTCERPAGTRGGWRAGRGSRLDRKAEEFERACDLPAALATTMLAIETIPPRRRNRSSASAATTTGPGQPRAGQDRPGLLLGGCVLRGGVVRAGKAATQGRRGPGMCRQTVRSLRRPAAPGRLLAAVRRGRTLDATGRPGRARWPACSTGRARSSSRPTSTANGQGSATGAGRPRRASAAPREDREEPGNACPICSAGPRRGRPRSCPTPLTP